MQKISIESLPIGIFKINLEKKIDDVNKSFCQISGYTKEELLGNKFLSTIHSEDISLFFSELTICMDNATPVQFEFRFVHKDKEDIFVLCNIVPEDTDKNPEFYICTITNITELKVMQLKLKSAAHFDSLTELPNRYLFEEILTKNMYRSKRNKMTLALLYVDIDNFKNINDAFGHNIGDIFLKEVGTRLKQSVREEDYVARLGGDEFAIILVDIHNINTISLSAERIIEAFRIPYIIDVHEIQSSISIGISIFTDEILTAEEISQHADQALYQAKESGKNCYKYYNKSMQEKLERYMLIVKNLKNAIDRNEFELYYQPKVDAKNGALIGMESLLRWNNLLICNLSPSEFIPAAEEAGLMNEIGSWVINTAFSQYKKWHDHYSQMKNITISINISAVELNDSRIIDTVSQALKENNIPTRNILFELTETAVMKKTLDSKSMLLTFLMELGIGISIDDFGTGYSSLTYLKQLPIKELKIDKSFIDDIHKNKNGESIVKAVISLAKTLDLEVVAEGVETKEQLDFLKENQCKIIQGYYFSKPLSVTEMTAYIESMDNLKRSN